MSRRRVAVVIGVVVVAVLAMFSALRRTPVPIVTIGYPPTTEQIEASVGAARDFESAVPLLPAAEPGAVAAAVVVAASRTPSAVGPGEEATMRLAEDVAAIVHHFASHDAEAYAAWQRRRGAELDLNRAGLEEVFRRLTGEALPADASDEQVFRQIFEGSLAADRAALRPKTVAAGENGLLVVFGSQVRDEDIFNAFLDTPSDAIHDRWLGHRSIAGRRHWRPPVDRSDIIAERGSVQCAWIMIGCKGARGDWYALHLDAYFDPDRQTWWIENARVQNTYGFVIAPQF